MCTVLRLAYKSIQGCSLSLGKDEQTDKRAVKGLVSVVLFVQCDMLTEPFL